MNKLLACMGLAAVWLTVNPAFASEWITENPNQHINRPEAEVHAVLGFGDFGAGFRVGIPVVKQGFIDTLNDNAAVNFGIDLLDWPAPDYRVAGVVVPVMLQWNFFITRSWSLFGEGGVAFQSWFAQRANGNQQTFFVWPGLGVGARYYFKPGSYPALILRVSYPSGISVGVGF